METKKYIVRFLTKSGEYDREWTYARSLQEAKEIITSEHWDIEQIISVEQLH